MRLSIRHDPKDDVENLKGCWSTHLDPMAYGANHNFNSRMVIDACIPWDRKKDWPATVQNSEGLERAMRDTFGSQLPKGR